MEHLIVPVDGSNASWSAVAVAVDLARKVAGRIDVVQVVPDPAEVSGALLDLEDGIAALEVVDVELTPYVDITSESVAGALADRLEAEPESTMVMASHGRGRSAALLGSVAEDLLGSEFGPIVVVGPKAVERRDDASAGLLSGPLLVTVDGSEISETALPLAVAWAIELEVTPWVIAVIAPDFVADEHVVEASYPSRLARGLRHTSGHAVEFEVLHGRDVTESVSDHAGFVDASLIVAATHGRTGLSRLKVGSTAAGFVRHAPCPVVLTRPPLLIDD